MSPMRHLNHTSVKKSIMHLTPRRFIAIGAAVATLLTSPGLTSHAVEPDFPLTSKRIVFLGDSITYAGHFVDVLDATLAANGYSPEIINIGLPSETCCGLSEPDHPFPRPNVQTRIDRCAGRTGTGCGCCMLRHERWHLSSI